MPPPRPGRPAEKLLEWIKKNLFRGTRLRDDERQIVFTEDKEMLFYKCLLPIPTHPALAGVYPLVVNYSPIRNPETPASARSKTSFAVDLTGPLSPFQQSRFLSTSSFASSGTMIRSSLRSASYTLPPTVNVCL